MRSFMITAAILSACTSAPPPDPPNPPRVELLELTPVADHVLVLGLPGAAEAQLRLVAVDLDGSRPAGRGFVAADGSFLIEVPADEGHVIRIQTEDARRSEPVDVIAAFGPASPLELLAPCFEVPATLELGGGPLGIIELVNACSEPALVTAIAPRAPAPLRVSPPAPFEVPAGARTELRIERDAAPIDEVLIVGTAIERRAISVVGD